MFFFADSADALYHADYMDVQMDELCLEKAYSIGKHFGETTRIRFEITE